MSERPPTRFRYGLSALLVVITAICVVIGVARNSKTPITTAIALGLCAAFLGLEHHYKLSGRELPTWFRVFKVLSENAVRIVEGFIIGAVLGVFIFSPLTAWIGLNSWYALGLGAVIGAIAGYFSKFLP